MKNNDDVINSLLELREIKEEGLSEINKDIDELERQIKNKNRIIKSISKK